MLRRVFLKSLALLAGGLVVNVPARASAARGGWIILQVSPLAGFQYHAGEQLWPLLAVGQSLELVRESANPYDGRAVRVEWQGRKLGYIPRMDNAAVAQLLDRGAIVRAHIAGLQKNRSPWERVQLEVRLWA
jgi:hypothetical protein